MGILKSKNKLEYIDLTSNENSWKSKLENMLNIDLHLVRQGEDISLPWLIICNAKFQDNNFDVIGTIPERLPNTQLPGMVIMIIQGERYRYTSYYPDSQIKYITCVDSGFKNPTKLRESLEGFISKDWGRFDRNKYNDHNEVTTGQRKQKATLNSAVNRPHKFEMVKQSLSKFLQKNFPESPRFRLSSEPKSSTTESKLYGFLLNIDHNEVTTGQRKQKATLNSAVNRPHKFEMVKQSLSKFLQKNFPESPRFRLSSEPKSSTTESKLYGFLLNIGNDNSKTQNQGECIRCVVHHVEEMTSDTIKVCGNQHVGRQVHIIVEKERIDGNLVINNQARKGIQTFLDENSSGGIDVILQIQYESNTVYKYLKCYLSEQMKGVQINFLQVDNTPTHPWIFVCDTFDEDKFLKLKETSKDHGSMLLEVHGCRTIPIEAEIEDKSKDDNKQIFLLFLGNSEIDDSLYMNDCAKHELRKIIGNIAGVPKRIHIKCLANLPKKAFSNFTERYITRIEPIWITEEDPIEEGSICIVVCFTFSRLQDDIAAVLRVTPQGCTNMLVVIQNCREGMSPGSMLKSNLNDIFKDFTNILYDDGECYDCHINSLAAEKVQAFIDNN
ncbi:uncharacterized protein LOC125675752 isoform X2 [Ostrea edulis]|uniref:uncharacterized protein LOC125675752 isoform X2 n=1 Tax=Ostrea edulis TaxID=37623 RepID=UPI0024AEACC4|nr:uncharacterized protein LOC125675752 isoform X2 [Ostrea edulis]